MPLKRKGKRGRGGKTPEGAKEGKITHSSQQAPSKEAPTTRAQQKKSASSRTSKEAEGVQPLKPFLWRPFFTLSSRGPIMNDSNIKDPQIGRLGLVAEFLEKVLCLPKDMHELRSFRKHEVVLSLERDLAKVCNHFSLFMNKNYIYINTNLYQLCSLSKQLSWSKNR